MKTAEVRNPEALSPISVRHLLLGAQALLADEQFPDDHYAWVDGNRTAKNVTAYYDDVEQLPDHTTEVVLAMPRFFMELDEASIRGINDLEDMPAPHKDSYFEVDPKWGRVYRGSWMRPCVGLVEGIQVGPSITYGLYATPQHTGYARTSSGVLTVDAKSYDSTHPYTPMGFQGHFGQLLAPIVAKGEQLTSTS